MLGLGVPCGRCLGIELLSDEALRERAVDTLYGALLGPRCHAPQRPELSEGEAQPRPPGGEEEPLVVVWVSVDPQSGDVSAYPSDCACRIEDGHQQGAKSVSLQNCGGAYEDATIELHKMRPEQHSSNGLRREVRRVKVLAKAEAIELHVMNEHGWRFSDVPVPGSTSLRRLDLPGYEKVIPPHAAVVWVSIDPRSGAIHPYPADCASRIEDGFKRGLKDVSLVGLGGFYEGTTIDLKNTRSGRPEQRSRRGRRRDVRRVEVPTGAGFIEFHVLNEGGWRSSDEPVPGTNSLRRLDLHGFEKVITLSRAYDSGIATGGESGIGERRLALQQSDDAGRVGLWEWCRLARVECVEEVPDEQWALYDQPSTEAIEGAFRVGKASVRVVVGIRTFEIIFDGPVYGRQVDHTMRRSRRVRRRALAPEERDQLFRHVAEEAQEAQEAGSPGRDVDQECAICCSSFAETPLMPAMRIPECGHWFHRACILDTAQKKAGCPMCRAQVDWAAALADR